MILKKTLEEFILFDKSKLNYEIKRLKNSLGIKDFKIPLSDIDSLFIKNLPIEKSREEMLQHLQNNQDKVLELYCNYKGKMTYLSSFGKINKLNKEKLGNILKLVILIRLFKKIEDVSYYASEYYLVDNRIEHVFTE